jgi:hypothetical protein
MIKFTTFGPTDNENRPLIRVLNAEFEKTAEYRADVKEFIDGFEKKANHTYILVNAMTSGDFYGPNLNGDYFPDDQLVRHHKSFEKMAYAYRHHKNKDPKESAGKVVFASHNPDMHRVELIVELEDAKAQDILDRLSKGEFPAVSMGVRTPTDRCSICDNRAKNTMEYCDHLRYDMRRIMDNGKRVMAINDDRLNFFDISFVRIPADRTASVMAKVASGEDVAATPSALIGDAWLKDSGLKESALTKEIPAEIGDFSADPARLILDSQKRIPTPVIDKLASAFPLQSILSTFLGLRVMPRPEEFQRLVLMSTGKEVLSNQLLEHGYIAMDLGEDPTIPIDVTMAGFNTEVAGVMREHLPGLSLTKPLIIKRAMLKRADMEEGGSPNIISRAKDFVIGKPGTPRPSPYAPKTPLIPLAGLGALYMGFGKLMNSVGANMSSFDSMDQLLLKNPWMIPLFVGAVSLGTEAGHNMLFKKEAGTIPAIAKRVMVAVPASYLYAGSIENKLQKGHPISKFEDMVRKHPFLTGMSGAGLHSYLWPKIKQDLSKLGSLDRVVYGLGPDKFEELYNDAIGVTNP